MIDDRELTRAIDRWLDHGPTQMPDRVVEVVASRIAVQRQRRAWRLPDRRPPTMSASFRIVAVAAALLAVIVGGSVLLQAGGGAPDPGPSVDTADSSQASPSPVAASPPTPPEYHWPAPLVAGTYTTSFLWQLPFQLQFTVGDGWRALDVEIQHDEVSMAVHLVGNVYPDPCSDVVADPPLGPTVAELATGLAALPDADITQPTPVQLGRVASGAYLELKVRDELPCSGEGYRLWHDPAGVYRTGVAQGPPYWTAERPDNRIWILDVDGVRLVLSALSERTASQADLAMLQAVIDSIRVVRPDASPSAPPAPEPTS